MKKPRFETLAIKSVENKFCNSEPISTPIYLSSTYRRNSDGSYQNDLVYSRENNPNRKILEDSITLLENGKFGFAFSSGMAAISAVFQSFKSGDHVLLPDDSYYAVKKLMLQVFKSWDLTFDLVNMCDLNEIENKIKPKTALIWIESPSNPQLKVSDIIEIVKISKKNNILCGVDNTWATPVLQNPLDFGADIVMHSTTKYFGGHSDVIGGCLIVNDSSLAEKLKSIQLLSGAVPSPFDCWLISRGIQTLHLRVMKQNENAHKLAQFFENHPKIEQVNYPGLLSHPQYQIAKKLFRNGFGAMISILLKTDEKKSFEISTKLKYFSNATSLGGVESLVEHRKSVEGPDSLTPANLLRISVGIENIDDLIEDWNQVLK